MRYRREVVDRAMDTLSARRAKSQADLKARRDRVIKAMPWIKETEDKIGATGVELFKIVSQGGEVKEKVIALRDKNLKMQAELCSFLTANGYPSNYLEPEYYCDKCRDRGYTDNGWCDCFKAVLKSEAAKRVNSETNMRLTDFAAFDLSYYNNVPEPGGRSSQRGRMESLLTFCKNYAEEFRLPTKGILMQGGAGLGKTHLSLAIAKTVIEKGYDVIYGSAHNIFTKLEREKFGKDADIDTFSRLLSCDLLLLDDLGAEFTSPFVAASLYSIVNTRLLSGNPTIISTNYTMQELLERYSERIVSRLLDAYERLVFVGKDIRQQRRYKVVE